jgi:hypothetical protein
VIFLVLALALLFHPGAVKPQDLDNVTISGKVGSKWAVIPGATITATRLDQD